MKAEPSATQSAAFGPGRAGESFSDELLDLVIFHVPEVGARNVELGSCWLNDTSGVSNGPVKVPRIDSSTQHAPRSFRAEPRGNSEIHLLGASGTATIRDMTAERPSISLRQTGKRLHAIFKPGLWPRENQSLPAPSCII